MLDTSSTINRRACSHADVIPKASSIATKILCPVIRFRPLFLPAPSSYPRLLPTCLFFPPASSPHPPLLPTRLFFPPASPSRPPLLPTHLSFPPANTEDLHPTCASSCAPLAPQIHPQAHPRHTPRLSPATPPGTPQTHPSLPKVARNSSRASFADGLKTPEYQRSNFKT